MWNPVKQYMFVPSQTKPLTGMGNAQTKLAAQLLGGCFLYSLRCYIHLGRKINFFFWNKVAPLCRKVCKDNHNFIRFIRFAPLPPLNNMQILQTLEPKEDVTLWTSQLGDQTFIDVDSIFIRPTVLYSETRNMSEVFKYLKHHCNQIFYKIFTFLVT